MAGAARRCGAWIIPSRSGGSTRRGGLWIGTAGQGLRIGGGSARGYVLLVEAGHKRRQGVCACCRGGSEEGREVRLARTFSLRLGAPVQFHLLSSTGDRVDPPGEVV